MGDVSPRRHETQAERLDRNWAELLQEFRVAQTGVQVLFGFLLILPFQTGFAELSDNQRLIYLLVFACMTLATIALLAPVMAHRLLFRQKAKDQLVVFGNLLAQVALVCLGAAFVCAVGLITSFVLNATAAWISSGITAVLLLALWLLVPLTVLRRSPDVLVP